MAHSNTQESKTIFYNEFFLVFFDHLSSWTLKFYFHRFEFFLPRCPDQYSRSEDNDLNLPSFMALGEICSKIYQLRYTNHRPTHVVFTLFNESLCHSQLFISFHFMIVYLWVHGCCGAIAVFITKMLTAAPDVQFIGKVVIIRATCRWYPGNESAPRVVRLHYLSDRPIQVGSWDLQGQTRYRFSGF